MTIFPSNEQLRRENTELRQALGQIAETYHEELRHEGSRYHRGGFYNCPDPTCVRARTEAQKGTDNGQH
jgi:hypothetical protein